MYYRTVYSLLILSFFLLSVCLSVYLSIYPSIYLSTHLSSQLTTCSKVLPKKLTSPQLVKKFPEFYGTCRFISAFTSACHLSLSWTRASKSMPPHLTFWGSIIILSSRLWLGLPSCSFYEFSSSEPCIHLSCSPYIPHALSISFFLIWSPD